MNGGPALALAGAAAGAGLDLVRIVGVSFKINIMALNAIFLAKRAGSAALGFGVLSNELRVFSRDLRCCMEALTGLIHAGVNLHLNDKVARLLFSGDVGAALLPPEQNELFVTDFAAHIRHAEAFHRRWMGSNEAKRQWWERVGGMAIDMLCPQHGAIYAGPDVERFINWFDELPVGIVGS